MSQIEVGDTVRRVGKSSPNLWDNFAGGRDHFLVTSKWGRWLQLDDSYYNGDSHPWNSTNFEKVEGNQVSDLVKSPKHYQFFPDVEAIEIIASSLSVEGFRGYCIGNRLKYRLRAGNKDKLEQDIAKSDFYIELFNNHKHLCKDA